MVHQLTRVLQGASAKDMTPLTEQILIAVHGSLMTEDLCQKFGQHACCFCMTLQQTPSGLT